MSKCPKCSENIDKVSLYFSAFPLHFRCSCCNERLKLINSKPFWIVLLVCLSMTLMLVVYIPFVREYGFGVIIGVFGWLFSYHKVLPYLLRKDNLAIHE